MIRSCGALAGFSTPRMIAASGANDGLWDCYNDFHMGNTAELVVDKYKVTREAQDAFAVESQRKAVAAMERGDFDREICPVAVPQRKGDPVIIDTDVVGLVGNFLQGSPAFANSGSNAFAFIARTGHI